MKSTLNCIDTEKIYLKAFKSCMGFKTFPLSDGGDGFLLTMKRIFPELKEKKIKTLSCDGRIIHAKVLCGKDVAFIESALVCGVMKKHIPITDRSSEGVGILIKELYDKKRRVVLGIGGTLTCDIGYGMLKGLGMDCEAYIGTSVLKDLRNRKPYPLLCGVADVESFLEGEYGAVMYLKQKKATYSQIKRMKDYLNETSKKLKSERMKHSGAGGGLGLAVILAGGRVMGNFDFLNSVINLRREIKAADAIIVNEGSFDKQSMSGKLTGRIAQEALKDGKRVAILAGNFEIKPRKTLCIKVNMPVKKDKRNYRNEFLKSSIRTKELLYG